MPTLAVGEVRLYYESHGEGEPVMLVGPPWWPCTVWNLYQVPALGRKFRVIILDPRGVGRSEKPLEGYTVREYAADCVGLLDALAIGEVHLAGFALGAACCQAVAQDHPQRVRSLVIGAAPSGRSPDPSAGERLVRRLQGEIAAEGYESYLRHHLDNDEFAFSREFRRSHPEETARLAEVLLQNHPPEDCFYRQALERMTDDTPLRVAEIRCPTLVLVGAEDGAERGSSSAAAYAPVLAARIPGASLAIISGAKHMVYWEAAKEVNELLLKFFRQHSKS